MAKLQRTMRAFRAKMKHSKQGTKRVVEGDPKSQKNWKLGTGWYVGVDVYPTRDAELADPERLAKLIPGAIMPKNQEDAIRIIERGIKRSRSSNAQEGGSSNPKSML